MAGRIKGVSRAVAAIAIVASMLWEGPAAQAATCGNGQGGALLLGCGDNTATDTTWINNSTDFAAGFLVQETGATSTGVTGSGTLYGVNGSGGTYGVYATGTTYGVYGTGATYGVWGLTKNAGGVGVYGQTDANGDGVQGRANNGTGVSGLGGTYGVTGEGNTGVYGFGSAGDGVFGETAVNTASGVFGQNNGSGNGVYGHAHNSAASGVYGQNDGTGYGVAGRATNTNGGTGVLGDAPNGTKGVGVEADSAHGTALQVKGKAKFSRSGVVTIPAGSSSQVVSLGGVNAGSMILATAQQATSISVRGAVPADPSSGSFTIYLSGNAPAGGLKVAYFVLN